MNNSRVIAVAVFSLSLVLNAVAARADDVSGQLGISGIAEAAFPVGSEPVRKEGKVGPDFGGMLSYGISKYWGAGVSYDNIDIRNACRVQPILISALYSFNPDSRWTPTAQLGVGAASVNFRHEADEFQNFAARAGLGLDYFVLPDFTVGPQVSYLFIPQTTLAIHQIDEISAGLKATFYFGGSAPAPAKAVVPVPAPVAVVPPPAPVVVPVAVSLTPSQSVLGPGQAQQLTAAVSGSSNSGVTWSFTPNLGTLSPSGLYTAPTTIALPEKVTITATSLADGSKIAMSIIQLNPPAAAPQTVSIRLDVLFDTGKAVIKPEFDAQIRQVSDFMKNYPSAHAEIEGHTDNVGSAALNLALSQKRADAVRQYLIDKLGVDASRLTAKGYGATQPIADNKTAEGRAQNRRVVATLSAVKS